MKKLMIAAAIVCATAMSYGAVASWKAQAANIYDGTGAAETANKWSGAAYFFDGGLNTQQAVFNAFATDMANFDITKQAGFIQEGVVSSGSIVNSNVKNQFNYGEQAAAAGEYKDFFFVLIDGDKMYLSQNANTMIPSSTTAASINWKSQKASTGLPNSSLEPTQGFVAAGQWAQAQAVPEPTSGLLLLLGVAGMALRRRRA